MYIMSITFNRHMIINSTQLKLKNNIEMSILTKIICMLIDIHFLNRINKLTMIKLFSLKYKIK